MEEGTGIAATLRTAASAARMAGSIHEGVTNLRMCLGLQAASTYTDELGACLDEIAGRVESESVEPSADAHELAELLHVVADGTNGAMFDLTYCLRKKYGLCPSSGRSETWRHDGFYALADLIERIAVPDMSRYVELPLDADGVPIRPGDMLYSTDNHMEISIDHIEYCDDGAHVVHVYNDEYELYMNHRILTHRKLRTVDDVVHDCCITLADCDVESVEKHIREAYELGMAEGKQCQ